MHSKHSTDEPKTPLLNTILILWFHPKQIQPAEAWALQEMTSTSTTKMLQPIHQHLVTGLCFAPPLTPVSRYSALLIHSTPPALLSVSWL